ncbi:Conserved_hypothetical protein [Hexamita inflata]|uniref:CBM21 domain-containing protein n=1 Tax=Hexamita inflata TaxID=28002 RepID=A0AA86UC58_9EUKA|nr:Conserved hypothetical protein [Hexamita inflata]
MTFVNENNDRILSGVIKVANLGFEKQVIIHSTTDNWKTKKATHAIHVVNNDFKFNIVLDSIAHKIQFVIQFICAGQEYWDNNSGKNYSLFIGPIELFVAVSMSKGLCVYLKSDQSLYGVHKSETLKKDWKIVQQAVFGSVVSSLYLTEDNYLYVGDFGNAMLHCLRIQLTFELLNQYAVSVHKRRSNQIYAKQQQTHQNFKIQMAKINDSVSQHSSQLQIVANMFSQTMDGAYQ